jgi:hypothetical protein
MLAYKKGSALPAPFFIIQANTQQSLADFLYQILSKPEIECGKLGQKLID